jgi:hypothetical protein
MRDMTINILWVRIWKKLSENTRHGIYISAFTSIDYYPIKRRYIDCKK